MTSSEYPLGMIDTEATAARDQIEVVEHQRYQDLKAVSPGMVALPGVVTGFDFNLLYGRPDTDQAKARLAAGLVFPAQVGDARRQALGLRAEALVIPSKPYMNTETDPLAQHESREVFEPIIKPVGVSKEFGTPRRYEFGGYDMRNGGYRPSAPVDKNEINRLPY